MDIARIADWVDLSEEELECPHPGCGQEYIQPNAVVINAGGQITTITSEGTKMSAGAASGRGVEITIYFVCEEPGHESSISYQFHKGSTLRTVSFNRSAEHSSPGGPVIWRD